MIRTHNLSAEETNAVVAHVQQKLGDVDVSRIESVGAVIGSEVTEHALINLLVAFAALIAYISYRFEYRIGISCIIAITHDILVVLGTFALFQLEIDASFLAAILTVIGYSMRRDHEKLRACHAGGFHQRRVFVSVHRDLVVGGMAQL